ncbi:hypothetical protein HKX48_007367 [Thoreauomyces humboldtii]|nr:hypothetical protein HKX48_007367 [Thoreauomyces humboldtii]
MTAVRKLVESCSKGTIKNSTKGDNLGIIATFLKKAGPENCGMEKKEHADLVARYWNVARELNPKTPETPKIQVQNDADDADDANEREPEPVVFDFKTELEKIVAREEELYQVLYETEPEQRTHLQIQRYQDALILLMLFQVPNSRSNIATLKPAWKANVLQDNYFIPSFPIGTPTIVWNFRKVDRIKNSKRKLLASETEDEINKRQFCQPMDQKLDIPFMNPLRVGKKLSRFVQTFRKDSEYIFLMDNGTPFLLEDKHKQFEEFTKHILGIMGKGKGVQDIRPAQITAVRNQNLTKEQISQYVLDCHHSLEEQNTYWRSRN